MVLGKGLREFIRGKRADVSPGSAYFVSLGWGRQRGHPRGSIIVLGIRVGVVAFWI